MLDVLPIESKVLGVPEDVRSRADFWIEWKFWKIVSSRLVFGGEYLTLSNAGYRRQCQSIASKTMKMAFGERCILNSSRKCNKLLLSYKPNIQDHHLSVMKPS